MTRKFWLTGWRWQLVFVALALLALLPPAETTQAALKTWNAGTADWNNGANWSPAGVPTNSDDAIINNGGTAQISNNAAAYGLIVGDTATGTVEQTSNTLGVGYLLILGNTGGSSGTYNLSGTGSLSGAQYIGNFGTGTFTQNGGTNAAGGLFLGYSPGGLGVYNFNSGTLTSNVGQYIGYGGTGFFDHEGGTNSAYRLELGVNTGSTGTYNLSAGTLTVDTFLQIGLSGTGTLTQWPGTTATVTGTGIGVEDGYLYLGYNGPLPPNPAGSGTYNLQGGSLSARREYIGYTGTGTFIQTGGTNRTIDGSMYLGYNSTGSGTYVLSAPGRLLVGGELYVGYSGAGYFNQMGGTNSTGLFNLYLGYESTGSGTYTLSGGSLSADGETIGHSGTGTFIHSGGTNKLGDSSLRLGNISTGSGTYILSGSGSLDTFGEIVGFEGTGYFLQTGGTNEVGSASLHLGYNFTGRGTYDLQGGSLSVKNYEVIGRSGTGTFTQTGGTHTMLAGVPEEGNLYLGGHPDQVSEGVPAGSGTYNLQGGSLSAGVASIAGTGEFVGYSGSGTFIQDGGTNATARGLYLGWNATASGTYTLNNGNLSALLEEIGSSGTGTFNQNGGTNEVTSFLYLGGNLAQVFQGLDAGSGTYNLQGGSLSVAKNLFVGYSGTGTFNHGTAAPFGGTNNVTEILTLGANAGASGTYNLNGGSLSAGSEIVGDSGTGTFTQSGGTNTVGGSLTLGDDSGARGTYNLHGGSLLVNEDLKVGGSGTGTFNQSGGTNVVEDLQLGVSSGSTGTYILSGTGILSASEERIGDSGTATFTQTGGTNTVTGDLQIAPGPGTGTYSLLGGSLSVAGNYTQTARGTLEIGVASASSYGNFGVGGTASLAGTMRPVLQGGYIPDYGQVFADIIHSTGALSGTFDTLANQQITPIKSWVPVYNPNSFDLRVDADFAAVNASLTPNQQAVANMLDGVAGSAMGDLEMVLNVIGNLPTAGAIMDAYQQISPDKAAALPNLGFAAGVLQQRSLARRLTDLRFGGREMDMAGGFPGSLSLFGSKTSGIMLAYSGASLAGMVPAKRQAAAPEGKWGLWLDPAGVLGNQKSTPNQTGYDFSIAGFNAGVDYRVQDNLLVGLATGYSYTDASFKGSGGSVTSSTWPITLYAAYLPDTFYAVGSLGYALNLFDLERQLSFGGLSRTAKSSPTGHQFNAYGEAGYDFKLAPFVVTPTVSLAYSYISVESFTESGADSLNLKVGAQNADSLQTGVGAKVAVPLKTNSMKVVPQVYATYQHEFLNDSRGLNASLSGAGSTFAFTTDKPGRDFAVVGGNVTVFKNNLSGYVNYNAEVGRSNYTAHYIGAGLRYQF